MAEFNVVVSFHFDTEYSVEADTPEEAEQEALRLADEWKPYSSSMGYTDDWYDVQIVDLEEVGE